MQAIAQSFTRSRRPDDRVLIRTLMAISATGSLGAIALLIAGDPAQAATAFAGAVALNIVLMKPQPFAAL